MFYTMNMAKEKTRIPKGSGRERILSAATELFLENGYEATSPQAIYAKSGVGQGSFYYHFKNKIAVMDCVLEKICAVVEEELQIITKEIDDPLERLETYLERRLRGTKGCRLGRFIYENSSIEQEVARHMQHYLKVIRTFFISNIEQAQQQNTITKALEPAPLADLILASVQGAYVMTRMEQDDAFMQQKLADLKTLLRPSQ